MQNKACISELYLSMVYVHCVYSKPKFRWRVFFGLSE